MVTQVKITVTVEGSLYDPAAAADEQLAEAVERQLGGDLANGVVSVAVIEDGKLKVWRSSDPDAKPVTN